MSLYLGRDKVTVAQTWTTADTDQLTGQDKIVSPSTSQQTITVDTGYDYLNEVTIRPVTSSIDSNIVPSKILSGETILGVEGTVLPSLPTQSKTVTLQTQIATGVSNITITPSNGYTLSSVTVPTVTSSIDSNITAENIKANINILGVTGTYETPASAITITPTKYLQTLTPSTGTHYNRVYVPAVTSSIDSNIQGSNIKAGVSILGITGTYETPAVSISVNPSTTIQYISSSNTHYDQVVVNPVTSSIDQNITAENIRANVNILGVTGTYEPHMTSLNVTPSTSTQTIRPETGYDGFTEVVVPGDSDLISSNIVEGKNIFGVDGNVIPFEFSPAMLATSYTLDEPIGVQFTYNNIPYRFARFKIGGFGNLPAKQVMITVYMPDSVIRLIRKSTGGLWFVKRADADLNSGGAYIDVVVNAPKHYVANSTGAVENDDAFIDDLSGRASIFRMEGLPSGTNATSGTSSTSTFFQKILNYTDRATLVTQPNTSYKMVIPAQSSGITIDLSALALGESTPADIFSTIYRTA